VTRHEGDDEVGGKKRKGGERRKGVKKDKKVKLHKMGYVLGKKRQDWTIRLGFSTLYVRIFTLPDIPSNCLKRSLNPRKGRVVSRFCIFF